MIVRTAIPSSRLLGAAIVLALSGLGACDGMDSVAPGEESSSLIPGAQSPTQADVEFHVRPFKGQLSGTMYVLGFCAEGAGMLGRLDGNGNATHLGSITTGSVVCASMIAGGGFFGDVSVNMTAANGDQVLLHLLGTGVGPDGWETNEYEIAGGTGRFSHATGEVEQRVRLIAPPDPPTPGTWVSTFSGWISY